MKLLDHKGFNKYILFFTENVRVLILGDMNANWINIKLVSDIIEKYGMADRNRSGGSLLDYAWGGFANKQHMVKEEGYQ